MARVIGVGGVFFKSPDPARLRQWYVDHLGVSPGEGPGVMFRNSDQPPDGYLVWGAFHQDTSYFDPVSRDYMFNLVVDDLDGALAQAAAGGGKITGEIEEYDYGRFGWFVDPDGNKVELWQPADSA
jgi:predicted enzyme related to lactoylglutathione lyase